ncbi:hypothetical protein QJS66_05420 [Kocuria rhizophila]|nr:hypothetical protein QJS66_05420 [Kocuria rhizophila]
MIHDVTEKYGDERVAMHRHVWTIKASRRSGLLTRAGYPFSMGERLTKAMPPDVMGKGISLQDVYTRTPSATTRPASCARRSRTTESP